MISRRFGTHSAEDKRWKEVLNQPVEIPAEVEERIQEAYRSVQAKCSRKGTEIPMKKKSIGKAAVALAAAGIMACASLGVLAASGFFTKEVIEEEGNVTYEFELNYDLQPVQVEAVPGYLPEGVKEQQPGKYWSDDHWGQGISIMTAGTAALDAGFLRQKFDHVESVEKTTLDGMEAHVITFRNADDERYACPTYIYLFNPDEGYVIAVFGDAVIPVDELKKVADSLEITVSEDTDIRYLTEEEKGEMEEAEDSMISWLENGIPAENLTAFGEELVLYDLNEDGTQGEPMVGYTLLDTSIVDSVYDIPGYTETGVYDREELSVWLNEDGTLKTYQREHYEDGEDTPVSEVEIGQKILVVKAKATCYKGYDDSEIPLDAFVSFMEKQEDGTLALGDGYDMPVSNTIKVSLDGSCFYMDQPENLEGTARARRFFFKALSEGESVEYTMAFVVDADKVEGGDLSTCVLEYNGAYMEYMALQ